MRAIRFIRKHRLDIVMALPLLLFIVAFTYAPVIELIRLSFDSNGDKPGYAFGFDNYRALTGHFQFWRAFANTLIITFVGLLLELTVGLFVATQLNRRMRLRGLFRALYLLPLGIPTIVVAANMRYIFDTNGFLNKLLMHVGILDLPINWSGSHALTLATIIVSDMWKVTPMVMLILLAGLQSIPDDLYEAAKMDGARGWQTFRRITLPMLKPAITMALVVRGIDSFRIFELPLVLAGKSEPVLSTFVWSEYSEALNPYTSSAGSVILLVLILISIFSYLWLSGARRHSV